MTVVLSLAVFYSATYFADQLLTNLAKNNPDNKVAIARAGAFAPLVELVKFGTEDAKDNAACALGNLAITNNDIRVVIARAGAIPPLVELVK